MTVSCMVGLVTSAAAEALNPQGHAIDFRRVNGTAVALEGLSMFYGDTFSIRGWLIPKVEATDNSLTGMACSIDGGVTVSESAVPTGGFFTAEAAVIAAGYSGSMTAPYGFFRIDTPVAYMSTLAVGNHTVNVYVYDMHGDMYLFDTFNITIKEKPAGLAVPANLSLDAYTVGTNPEVATGGTYVQSITMFEHSTFSLRGWLVPTSGATPNKLTKLAYSLDDGDTLVDIEGSSTAFSEAEAGVHAAGSYSGGIADGNGNFRINSSVPVIATLAVGMHDVEIYAYDGNNKYYKWVTLHITVETPIAESVSIPISAVRSHNNVAKTGHDGYVTYKVETTDDPYYYIAEGGDAKTGLDYRFFMFYYRTTKVSNIYILAETTANPTTNFITLIKDGKWHLAVFDKNTYSLPVNSTTMTNGYRFGFNDSAADDTLDVADFKIGNLTYKNIAVNVPELAAASLTLTSDIGMNWYYHRNDDLTVRLKVTDSENNTVTLKAEETYKDEQPVFKFTCSDIAAKELGDNLHAVLEVGEEDAEGTFTAIAKSIWYDYSPAQYCKDMIARDDTNAATKTLCADLLNYAAEAQKYFGYKEDNLVTTGANLENATGTIDAPATQLALTTLEGATVTNVSNALALVNKIKVLFNFKGVAGTEYSVDFGNGKIETANADDNGNFSVVLDTLTAVDVDTAIHYAVYSGTTKVSGDYTYSISTYIARKWTATASGALVQAMWKYGKAADAAL